MEETSVVPPGPDLLPSPRPPSIKPLFLVVGFFLVAAFTAFATYFISASRFSVEKKATGEGHVVCEPLGDKYNANQIKVTNNTNQPVEIIWAYTQCDLSQWTGAEAPICRDNPSGRTPVTVQSDGETIATMNVDCGKYGQLDAWQNPDVMTRRPELECWNPATGAYWIAAYSDAAAPGIAYSFKKGAAECISPTPSTTPIVCVSMTASKPAGGSLASLKVGEVVQFVVTPSDPLAVVEAAAVRIMKNGVKVVDLMAKQSGTDSDKWTATYTIPEGGEGNYEALGFIKVGGVWK